MASAPGAYLWYDPDGGWALRVTHVSPRDTVVFSGALTTSGQFVSVHRASYNRADIVFVSRDRHTIVFRFVNYGWVDGLDFATQCSPALTMSIAMDGQLVSTDAIHLGGAAASPTNNPMRVERARGTGRRGEAGGGRSTRPRPRRAPPPSRRPPRRLGPALRNLSPGPVAGPRPWWAAPQASTGNAPRSQPTNPRGSTGESGWSTGGIVIECSRPRPSSKEGAPRARLGHRRGVGQAGQGRRRAPVAQGASCVPPRSPVPAGAWPRGLGESRM